MATTTINKPQKRHKYDSAIKYQFYNEAPQSNGESFADYPLTEILSSTDSTPAPLNSSLIMSGLLFIFIGLVLGTLFGIGTMLYLVFGLASVLLGVLIRN